MPPKLSLFYKRKSKTSPSLSVCFQEKVLLWLLQFMQEQAISLDEVDQNGNTAVHVAAQYGHLTCIQVCTACFLTAFSGWYCVQFDFTSSP